MLCWLSSPVAEATDGGMKCFVSINVKVSGLEGPACWSAMTRKEVGCPLDCCCCPLLATWFCWTGWMAWRHLAWRHLCLWWLSVSPGMVKVYSLAAGAGCCGCWNVYVCLRESVCCSGCWDWWPHSSGLLWMFLRSFTASFLNESLFSSNPSTSYAR